MQRLAILTYHPIHIVDATYRGNDLVALERDLETIERVGLPVVSLEQAIAPCGSPGMLRANGNHAAVAITFDDGSVFDYVDHDHPTCGWQRSAATILRDASRRLSCLRSARPFASTFVIASPDARTELDRTDYFGGNYWPDSWWSAAARDGALSVESHSWDHNHPSLSRTAQRDNVRGTFRNIETFDEAEAEIAQSVAYIGRTAGVSPKFFAYPWGESNPYLTGEYLPRRGREIGLHAAFGSQPGVVTAASDRWAVPRYVCGHDWKEPEALEAMLSTLARGG